MHAELMVDMLLDKYEVVSVAEQMVALAGRLPEPGECGRKAVMRGFLHPCAAVGQPPAAVRPTIDATKDLMCDLKPPTVDGE